MPCAGVLQEGVWFAMMPEHFKRSAYSGVALRQLAEVEQWTMFFIYAIYNQLADRIYIGQTADLSKRLEEHNKHIFKGYTSRFPGEWKLIYQESVSTRPEALQREKQLKSYRGREFVRKCIPG